MSLKQIWKKVWWFVWEDNSIWSWLVNIVLAFILIKFIVYPGLGLLLTTSHPIVAVVSTSMEHDTGFDSWWAQNQDFYSKFDITKEEFLTFRFKRGFNKGDIMKILIDRLKKEGINRQQLDRFKLYNPDTYDRLTQQARISVDIAVKDYKGIIQASNKRA